MPNYTINTRPPMPKTARPIVIIGAGGIVNDAHLPAYQKAGFPVAGIYDVNPLKARKTADTFGIPAVFDTIAEAVAKAPAEAVFDVAVPASVILDIIPQLPDNRGVLIQKPMGESLAEAMQIRDLCHQKNLLAGINFQLRYAPFVLAARSLIEQGAIGQLHDMEVRITAQTPWHLWSFFETVANVEIVYHSIHYMDLMRSFLGEPHGVYCKSVRHPKAHKIDGTSSDYALDYGDFMRAVITTNHHHEYGLKHQESYIKWEGSTGAIWAKMGLMLNYPKGVPDEFEFCVLEEGREPHWESVQIEGTWFPDAFIGTMASIMRAVEGTSDCIPTSVSDAYQTMSLVDAACASSNAGATPFTPIQEAGMHC